MSKYETVIGLEVHVQLSTASKAFCADDARFGAASNTHTSIVSLAHPGTLPRLNKRAVEYAIRLGLASGCKINQRNSFDRKNYFYADSPKGFQTTQDKNPICIGGSLHGIRIHHIHLEEDAGKSIHDQHPTLSMIDLNRAGVPLLEIVTEPDFRSGDQVTAFMEDLRRLVRWVEVSDGNMEEGSMRCDVNVSIRIKGESLFGNRCEIKNMNSMRFARRAIAHETERQIKVVESGGVVTQETRGFDAENGTTYSLRAKEDAHDYRYFPEPDLPPVIIPDALLRQIESMMPILPQALENTWIQVHGLSEQQATMLTQDKSTADYFDLYIQLADTPERVKSSANFVINKLIPWSTETGKALADCPVKPESWILFLGLIQQNKISASTANQHLFPALLTTPDQNPESLAETLHLIQKQDNKWLESIVLEVLARMPDKVLEYKKGKKGLLALFIGEVMKAAKGKANPQETTKILNQKLN